MAYTTINKSTDYFNTKLYTGNNGTQSITGVGHQPDLIWVKARNDTANHTLTDAVRGTNSVLYSNQDQAQDTPNNAITSFDSDGFSVGSNGSFNANSINYASWNWKANGAGSSNTDGSISSTVSVNTTAGFSIVKYTGTGSTGTIGHGLGVAPKVVIVKRYTAAADWVYYTTAIDGSMDYLFLNTTATKGDSGNSAPTSTVFSKDDTNGETQIAYCFAEKTGYSKFGSYTGNGNADGSFIYTGFKPAFVMVKRTNNTGHWQLVDTKRPSYNPQYYLRANSNNAEATDIDFDIVSNGFKTRSTDTSYNGSGDSYIYMAFAEAPLVGSNNVPCTAR
jgi:hypothetical protein